MCPQPGKNCAVMYDAQQGHWRLFRQPEEVLRTDSMKEVQDLLRHVERETISGDRFAAGFVSYDATPAFDPAYAAHHDPTFPLVWFGLYRQSVPVQFPVCPTESADCSSVDWTPSVSVAEYRDAIARIRSYIAAGDTYQVNYSLRLRAILNLDPWDLFIRMIHAQGKTYGAFVDTGDWIVCSASPELFYRRKGNTLIAKPMKGTAARGRWPAEDIERAAWLKASIKNRAENVMIVDMVRNDLGRVAQTGSVHVPALFEVQRYPTVWQMTSTVACTTQARLTEVLEALFPAASITGAPKARTTEIIAELETTPRRLYTGAVGYVMPGGDAQFNVAIRTLILNRRSREAEFGVGGGIVWDSEDMSELEECRTKAQVLTCPPQAFDLLETLLWTPDAGIELLDRHMARLLASSDYFGRPVDEAVIRERLRLATIHLPPVPHKLRLRLDAAGKAVVEVSPLTPLPATYCLGLARTPVNSGNIFLYHKTTQRQIYDAALAEVPDCHDALLWNERGEITESCIANVVVELGGKRVTPPVASGLLPGTYRAMLLDRGDIVERIVHRDDLQACSRLWLLNSVRGMWEPRCDMLGHMPDPRPHQTSPDRR